MGFTGGSRGRAVAKRRCHARCGGRRLQRGRIAMCLRFCRAAAVGFGRREIGRSVASSGAETVAALQTAAAVYLPFRTPLYCDRKDSKVQVAGEVAWEMSCSSAQIEPFPN